MFCSTSNSPTTFLFGGRTQNAMGARFLCLLLVASFCAAIWSTCTQGSESNVYDPRNAGLRMFTHPAGARHSEVVRNGVVLGDDRGVPQLSRRFPENCLRLRGAGKDDDDDGEEEEEPPKKKTKKKGSKEGKKETKKRGREEESTKAEATQATHQEKDPVQEESFVPQAKSDAHGEYFELEPLNINAKTGDTTQKRLSVTIFSDQVFVNIREFYEDANKQMKPGRRGISLSVDQWDLVTHFSSQVDEKVKQLLKEKAEKK